MSNREDVVAFGPIYLDFFVNLDRRTNLFYGRDVILDDYELTQDGFLIGSLYDDRNLQLIAVGDVENGSLRLKINGEEISSAYTTGIGGSTANFAVQLRHLDLDPLLIGRIGKDRYGNRLKTLLHNTCKCSLLGTSAKQTLGINISEPETHENAGIVTGSSNGELRFEDLNMILQEVLTDNQFLYAGGFFKQKQLYPYYPQIFKRAQERGCRVVLVDGKFWAHSPGYQEAKEAVKVALKYVDIYLPSIGELIEFTGNSDLEYSLKATMELGPKLVVCKRGAEGCSFITIEDPIVRDVPQEHKATEILRTVGAGDSFNGGLIKGLVEGLDIERAVRLGNITAYLKITRGVYPTYSDVIQLLT